MRPGTFVFFNRVGTFGISSAAYCWSRIGSGIGSLYNMLWVHLRPHGSCWLQMIIIWRRVVLHIVQVSSRSSSYAHCSVSHFRGARRQAATPSHGWRSSFSMNPIDWVCLREELNGSVDGARRCRRANLSTQLFSKRDWA